MHLDHLDLTSPPAIVSAWESPTEEIRAEVLNFLQNLTDAIRKELNWYAENDEESIEHGKLLQRRLVNSIWEPKITEYELEVFLKTLEDNKVLKETLRMLYGNRQQIIEAIKKYQDEVDGLMKSDDPGLQRFLRYATQDEHSVEYTITPELQAKLDRAKTKTNLIVGISLYPMDNLIAQYTTPHSPPSRERWEHSIPQHIPEEAPLQSERWSRWLSWLWQRLRKSLET